MNSFPSTAQAIRLWCRTPREINIVDVRSGGEEVGDMSAATPEQLDHQIYPSTQCEVQKHRAAAMINGGIIARLKANPHLLLTTHVACQESRCRLAIALAVPHQFPDKRRVVLFLPPPIPAQPVSLFRDHPRQWSFMTAHCAERRG